jgi:hypothetical protein
MVMIVGSFLLYCGQSALNPDGGGPGDGFVTDAAAADDCGCTTGPTFTKLAEGTLGAGTAAPPIAVGEYREAIMYVTSRSPAGCSVFSGDVIPRFRPDAATAFGESGQYNYGRIRVDGTDLQLTFTSTTCTSINYVVAGVH